MFVLHTGRIASVSFLMMRVTGAGRSARVGGGGHHHLPSANASGQHGVYDIFACAAPVCMHHSDVTRAQQAPIKVACYILCVFVSSRTINPDIHKVQHIALLFLTTTAISDNPQ